MRKKSVFESSVPSASP